MKGIKGMGESIGEKRKAERRKAELASGRWPGSLDEGRPKGEMSGGGAGKTEKLK
jgi:hypothetical protein